MKVQSLPFLRPISEHRCHPKSVALKLGLRFLNAFDLPARLLLHRGRRPGSSACMLLYPASLHGYRDHQPRAESDMVVGRYQGITTFSTLVVGIGELGLEVENLSS